MFAGLVKARYNSRHVNACLSHRCIAECIGTFALVFAGCGAIVVDSVSEGAVTHVGVALTFGLVIMVMIYAVGDVSGAHFNPAVTLAFWVARRFPLKEVGLYILSQLVGAVIGAGLLRLLFNGEPDLGVTNPAEGTFWWQSAVLEVVLTFILMFVILHVATGAKEKGVMAGVAIGGTVGLEAMFAGPICGASMNPARSIAPAIFSHDFTHLWFYIAAPIVGAMIAVPICLACSGGPDGCCSSDESCDA